jgi:hypothetical protein
MQDNTRDAFQVQEEKKVVSMCGTERGRYQGGPQGGYGHGHGHRIWWGEVDPPHVLIAVRLVMSHDFVPNHMCSVHIVIVLNM